MQRHFGHPADLVEQEIDQPAVAPVRVVTGRHVHRFLHQRLDQRGDPDQAAGRRRIPHLIGRDVDGLDLDLAPRTRLMRDAGWNPQTMAGRHDEMTAFGHHRGHARGLQDELVASMRVARARAFIWIRGRHRRQRPLDLLQLSGIVRGGYGSRLLAADAQAGRVISSRCDFQLS